MFYPKVLFIGFGFTCILTSVYSQNINTNDTARLVQYKGIVQSASGELLPNVNIVNLQTRRGTITNFQGFFSIACRSSDTLCFSCVGFKRTFLPVKNADFSNGLITIVLYTDTLLLDVVRIQGSTNYQSFKQEFMKKENFPEHLYRMSIPGVPTNYNPKLTPPVPTVMNPVSLLYEYYKTSSRLQRRLETNRKKYKKWFDLDENE